jgi:flagellar protein FlaG
VERLPAAGLIATPAVATPRSDAAAEQAGQAAPSRDQLARAVAELNKSQQAKSQGLEFSIDTDTRRTVVKVVDQATREVLRQIPTPEALEIAKALEAQSTKGVLIQQTA